MMKTFHLKTYGCQMNERDSESVAGLLCRHGLTKAASESQADIIIVNSCSVRGKAEDKALGKLGLLVASRREFPHRVIGVMGCMVQRLGGAIFERVPGVDFAVGTRRHASIPGILEMVAAGEGPVLDAGMEEDSVEALTDHEEGGISAFVNILFGCNRRCANCIVPSVRGREWSRPADGILAEVAALAAAGVREVTLLGQSVMLYGARNEVWPVEHVSAHGYLEPLPRLLEAVNAIPGIERIRFTSGHPTGCSAELCRAMAELSHVAAHLHIPVQSGSDRILKLMRRGYTAADYLDAAARLRAAVPDIVVTTDVIVGFPSETAAEFEETRQLMDRVGFDNAFIFKYSPRPGTPAAEMEDDVSEEEKKRRNQVMLADQDRRGMALNEAMVGTQIAVLVQGVSKRNTARWAGRSAGNKIVVFEPVDGLASGDMIEVSIERAMAQTLYGTIVVS
jgi:tRNA-2-methylthio-N6-dimethylallyladenosine synthase